MSFNDGENIGLYQIVEKLGQGGMAAVYKAYHQGLDRYVAIKVIHSAYLEDENFRSRFQREARIIARLEHPNIVPVYDFAEHEGHPYLVMKFIDGKTLRSVMEEKRLSYGDILSILEAVGSALTYAHERNVLHRDIKPANVILSNDGQIYLADFGLARLVQSGASSLTGDQMVGTPHYMSPEQAVSAPDLDARTDIYSLGIMLYEMVVGNVPFNSDTPFTIIHDHIFTPLPLPRNLNLQIPEELEGILVRALAKKPEDRYPDVNSLVNAFRIFMQKTVAPRGLNIFQNQANESFQSGNIASLTIDADTPEDNGQVEIQKNDVASPIPEKKGKFKKMLLWGSGGIAALILLSLCLLGSIPAVRKFVNIKKTGLNQAVVVPLAEQNTPPTLEGTIMATDTQQPLNDPPVPGATLELMNQAIQSWKNGDRNGAVLQLVDAYRTTGDRPKFINILFQQAARQEAWLFAASFVYFSDRGNLDMTQGGPGQNKLRQILYMAARDQAAATLFSRHAGEQLFSVAAIRYELYFGSLQKAKSQLDQFTATQAEKRYPESHLLEAEIFNKQGDTLQANTALDKLLQDGNMPEWVRLFALDYKNTLGAQ